MGNAISMSTQNFFYTSCMAKYTNITKPQVMAIRNLLVLLSQQQPQPSNTTTNTNTDGPMMIQRKHLQKAMQKVNISKDPDHEVIDLLFTMWLSDPIQEESMNHNTGIHETEEMSTSVWNDITTKDTTTKKSSKEVPWYEFLISLSLLACKTDTLEQAIRFALYVVHRNHFYHSNNNNGSRNDTATTTATTRTQQGYISSSDAFAFIQGICTTATFYGDTHTLQSDHIHKMVDRIYDSSNKVTFENIATEENDNNSIQQKELSFDEFVKSLLRQGEIRDLVVLPLSPKQIRLNAKRASKSTVPHQQQPVMEPATTTPTSSASRRGSAMARKSAMKMKSMYDESNVKNHFPLSPKSPRNNNNNINSNKYMPLIDEIEKDARTNMKHGPTSKGKKTTTVTKKGSAKPMRDIATSSSSSSSNDDIDAIDPNSIHVTTTEEEEDDDDNDDDDNDNNSLQDQYKNDSYEAKSETDDNIKNDAILTTLKANNKKIFSSSKAINATLNYESLKQQHPPSTNNQHYNTTYSMGWEASETTYSPSSVPSTDLSSHMSSVMLKPLARIIVSNHSTINKNHNNSNINHRV